MNRNKYLADCTVQEFMIICKSLIDYYFSKRDAVPPKTTVYASGNVQHYPGHSMDFSSVDLNQVKKTQIDSVTVDVDLKTKDE